MAILRLDATGRESTFPLALHAIQVSHAPAGLLGPRLVRLHPLGVLPLVIHPLLLLLVFALGGELPDPFGLGVVRVRAGVDRHLPVVEVHDLVHHPIEQVAVVRDDDRRAVVAGQELLEELRGLDVQVVRRLVEQQKIGLLKQQLGQRRPALLTTRQSRDGQIVVGRREAQPAQHLANGHFVVIAARRLQPMLEFVVLGHQVLGPVGVMMIGDELGDLGHPLLELADVVERAGHLGQQRVGRVQRRFLRQIRDLQAASPGHRADLRLNLAGDELEQRGLARPVRSDQADLLPSVDHPVQLVEHDLPGKADVHILERHDPHTTGSPLVGLRPISS